MPAVLIDSGSEGVPPWEPRASSAFSVAAPSTTSPKMVCLPSSQGVGTKVRKNWLPSVPGPAWAMLSMPGRSCLTEEPNSPA